MLAAAQMIHQYQRYGMLVTSTANRAASTAGHESGAPWMNLTELFQRIRAGQVIRSRVIVVDEASMADVTTIARVADWCAEKGKRLILQGDRTFAVGTVLRVVTPRSDRDPSRRLVRGDRVTVLDPGRDRIRVRFDDGTERSLTPRTATKHLDYGYAGTTHKIQGQTSDVHVASLAPGKAAASLYVSATRARERTLFIADARDYLADRELQAAQTSDPDHLDDEVFERVRAELTRRPDRLDSPRVHLRAIAHVEGIDSGHSSFGMSM